MGIGNTVYRIDYSKHILYLDGLCLASFLAILMGVI